MLYSVDGDLVPAADATVSVRDRGFQYGDAVFETMRAYDGRVFRLDAHLDRLANSCSLLGIDHELPAETFRERVRETLDANDLAEAYVKLSVSRGVQPGKLDPDPATDPTVVVQVRELDREPTWGAPATLETSSVQRVPREAIPAAAKTHNYLNGVLARRSVNADEALLLDASGSLTEGATSNVFFVRDGVLRTPSLDGPILPGITREVVLDVARDADIPVETGRYDPAALRRADEVFLTNSTWELRPVRRYDDTTYEAFPVTERLHDAYRARTRRST
ncbi:aminotransferase class IV [Salarchaeum sp. JOR-1]|uniref:aminotransferase class IV n=1 Tax=Salarchaeum sp. JOR-1 TaxID=2599399 RepID=UPI001198451E|nr:aminotransferase class IV [Salarchaeum sp. JOR-1]QDX39692.1 aminodeoxychorismate lyase [Salarchaeum sp. JOR-1]